MNLDNISEFNFKNFMENNVENINNNTEVERGWKEDLKIGFLAGLFSFIVAEIFLGLFFKSGIFAELFLTSGFSINFLHHIFSTIKFIFIIAIPAMLGIAVGRHYFIKRGKGGFLIYVLPQIFPLLAYIAAFLVPYSAYIALYAGERAPFVFCASIIVHIFCEEAIQGVKMVRERQIIRWAALILFALIVSLIIYRLIMSFFVWNIY